MDADNPYVKARDVAEQTDDAQERNRLWWETLPMTYAGWDEANRLPKSAEDFAKVEQEFLDGNPWLKECFDFKALAGKKVLEIGFGTGVASCLLAKGGADVTGIDITNQAVEIATANAAAQGLTNVKFQRMDAEKLEFPDDTFDYVFTWGVLHHSNRTEEALKQLGRSLKKGGRGMIMVYNKASFRFWGKGFRWLFLKGKIFKGYNMQTVQGFATDGYYQRHFSPRELRRALGEAGLGDFKTSVSHMNKRYVPGSPRGLDEWFKRKYGWLLVVEFEKV